MGVTSLTNDQQRQQMSLVCQGCNKSFLKKGWFKRHLTNCLSYSCMSYKLKHAVLTQQMEASIENL